MMHPKMTRASKEREPDTFASDAALMKHLPPFPPPLLPPPLLPPPSETGLLPEDDAEQAVMVSPTSAQTAFEKALSFPAVSKAVTEK
jgi:hypothetical protein